MEKENQERNFKLITLIGLRNMLTNATIVIDESTFYYTFKKGDDNEPRLHLSGVIGGLYECLPPEEQFKVLRDKLKEIILAAEQLNKGNKRLPLIDPTLKGNNDSKSTILSMYKIPEDYAQVVIYEDKTFKR